MAGASTATLLDFVSGIQLKETGLIGGITNCKIAF